MGKLKVFFSRKVPRVLAVVLAATMLVSALSVLAVTRGRAYFAAENPSQAKTETERATPLAGVVHDTVNTVFGKPENVLSEVRPAASTSDAANLLYEPYMQAVRQIAGKEYTAAFLNIERCIEIYDGAVDKQDPGNELATDLWLKKGYLALELGDYEEGLSALERALSFSPDNHDVYLLLAQAHEALGMYGEMSTSLGRYLELAPTDEEYYPFLAELWLKKGDLHIGLGEFDLAFEAIERILEIDPVNFNAYLLEAKAFAILERYEDMYKSLTRYMELNPEDLQVRGVLDADPENPENFDEIKELRLKELYTLAVTMLGRGEYVGALYYIEECTELCGELDETDPVLMADLFLKKGFLLKELSDFDGAFAALEMALDIEPDVPDAYLLRAQMYETRELYEDMSVNLARYLELCGDSDALADLWLNLGYTYLVLEEYAAAYSTLDRILTADPANTAAYLLQAQAHAEQGRYEDMHESLEMYLRYMPEDDYIRDLARQVYDELHPPEAPPAAIVPEVVYSQEDTYSQEELYILERFNLLDELYNLAASQINGEEFATALVNIDQCIEIYHEFDNPAPELLTDLWFKKGYLHTVLEDYENALDALGRVTELSPETAGAYLMRAQIFEIQERPVEAVEHIDLYLAAEVNVDDETAAGLWLNKAGLYTLSGDYDSALAAVGRVFELSPHNSGAYLLEAQIYMDLERYDDMYNCLSLYLEQYPDDEYIRSVVLAMYDPNAPVAPTVESEFLDGLYAMQEGDFQTATEAISRAIAIDGEYEGLYFHRGLCFVSTEDYPAAIEDFAASIQRGYMLQSSYFNMGISYILTNEYKAGLDAIKMAAELDEDDLIKERAQELLRQVADAETEARLLNLLMLAQAAADEDNYESMGQYLEEYLTEVPDDVPIRTVLAQTMFAGADYAGAMVHYAALLAAAPNAELEYFYGLAALQISEYRVAEQAFSGVMASRTRYPGISYYRGVCRMALGSYQGAISDFTQSMRFDEMFHSSLFNRGVCYIMMEQTDLGKTDLAAAAEMDGDDAIKEQATQLLRDLSLVPADE